MSKKIGISMDSNNKILSEIKLITDPSEIESVMEDDSIKNFFLNNITIMSAIQIIGEPARDKLLNEYVLF
ncbi:MAG TPA: hypothetical protein DIW17_07010 [Clostridiales bacterium]|nr:hypothetical protein [Clostridiales bacterium]